MGISNDIQDLVEGIFQVLQKIGMDRQISCPAVQFCSQLAVTRLLVNKPPL